MKINDIATVVSASCALVSLCALIYSNNVNNREKRYLVRPMFYSYFVSLGNHELKMEVKQLNNICSDLEVKWESNNNDNIKIEKEYLSEMKFTINLNYKEYVKVNSSSKGINGYIILSYKNIYGNKEKCKLNINFEQENYLKQRYFEFQQES